MIADVGKRDRQTSALGAPGHKKFSFTLTGKSLSVSIMEASDADELSYNVVDRSIENQSPQVRKSDKNTHRREKSAFTNMSPAKNVPPLRSSGSRNASQLRQALSAYRIRQKRLPNPAKIGHSEAQSVNTTDHHSYAPIPGDGSGSPSSHGSCAIYTDSEPDYRLAKIGPIWKQKWFWLAMLVLLYLCGFGVLIWWMFGRG